MDGGVCFLLLVSLTIESVLKALSHYIQSVMPGGIVIAMREISARKVAKRPFALRNCAGRNSRDAAYVSYYGWGGVGGNHSCAGLSPSVIASCSLMYLPFFVFP